MASSSVLEEFEDVPAKLKIPDLFKLVDQEKCNLIKLLKAAVAIPSMAHEPKHFTDIVKMVI